MTFFYFFIPFNLFLQDSLMVEEGRNEAATFYGLTANKFQQEVFPAASAGKRKGSLQRLRKEFQPFPSGAIPGKCPLSRMWFA